MSVPRLWPESTVVVLGTGPSLTAEDVASVRGRAKVVAVNNAYELAPWADVLYACDFKWWKWHQGVPSFQGMKYTLTRTMYPDVTPLKNTGEEGLELDPSGLRTGKNSGYQAINLAVHFGARRIVLLGFDMQGDHFFGSHPDGSRPAFALCLSRFETIVQPLKDASIEVINCTKKTALTCFPRMSLDRALASSQLEGVA